MAVEGGGDYRQRLVQRQLQIKKRKQAGLSDTRADAGPPSSKTFSSPPAKPSFLSRVAVSAGEAFAKEDKDSFLYRTGLQKIPQFVFPKYAKSAEQMTPNERRKAELTLLEVIPGIGDIVSSGRYTEGVSKDPTSVGAWGSLLGMTALSVANPFGGAGQVQRLTRTQRGKLLADLDDAYAKGDDEAAKNIEAILASSPPPRRQPQRITTQDKVKNAVSYAESIVKNPQSEVIVTAPDRTSFEALRWRVESGNEAEFSSVLTAAKGETTDTPVTFVLRPYGVNEKYAQANRFWSRSANKALSRAEDALSRAGVDIKELRTNSRGYSEEDIASMHSISRNTEYQVWERVSGSPIYTVKNKNGKETLKARGGGEVSWDEDAGIYRITKRNGDQIEFDPNSPEQEYFIHRGDHLDHLISKNAISQRIETLIAAGDVETAKKYYSFMNSAGNLFALHGGVNASKGQDVIKDVSELAPKASTAVSNKAVFDSQSAEYQTQLDTAWARLAEMVGPEEADFFYELHKRKKK